MPAVVDGRYVPLAMRAAKDPAVALAPVGFVVLGEFNPAASIAGVLPPIVPGTAETLPVIGLEKLRRS